MYITISSMIFLSNFYPLDPFFVILCRESRQPCLVPDFSGIISLKFSPFNLMLAIDLLYIEFIMFRYTPCIPDLSKLLTEVSDFAKEFFRIY